MSTSVKTTFSLVPDLAAWFVCRRFWDTSDRNLVSAAIVNAKPSTLLEAVLAGINWVYRPRSPLSRPVNAIERLEPILNELPADTKAFFLGEVRGSSADAKKHRERIRRFLWGCKPRACK